MNAAKPLTVHQADAFLEDADNAWLDAAEQHNVHPALAEVLMLESLVNDCFLAAPDEIRSFLTACLAELNCKDNTAESEAAMIVRNQAGEALAMKLSEQIDQTRFVTVTTGARLQ